MMDMDMRRKRGMERGIRGGSVDMIWIYDGIEAADKMVYEQK